MHPLLLQEVLLHPSFVMPSLLDLGKIFGVPVALYLLARHLTRRDKTRDDAAAEDARALRARNDLADSERMVLRSESEKNKIDHERFQKALDDMRNITLHLQEDVNDLKMDITRADMRGESTKETMTRIDGQLGRLIDTFSSLARA